MKTLKLFLSILVLSSLVACGTKKFEHKGVIVYTGALADFLDEISDQEITTYGDIVYYADADTNIIVEEEYMEAYTEEIRKDSFVLIERLPKEKKFTLVSSDNDGYKLIVDAEDIGDMYSYLYKKVTYISQSSSPHDSIVLTNVRLIPIASDDARSSYGQILLPIEGQAEKYYVDGKHISKTMLVEATEDGAIWNEYYDNGNIKMKTVYEYTGEKTKTYYYNEDGTEDIVFKGKEFAIYETDVVSTIDSDDKYYVILFPQSKNDIKIGDLVMVSSDNLTAHAIWRGEYRYKIEGDLLLLSEGRCTGGIFDNFNKIPMRHQEVNLSSLQSFTINNFCNGGVSARCKLIEKDWDSKWFLRCRRKWLNR